MVHMTKEQAAYVTANYSNTPNTVMIERLGVSNRTLVRMARQCGVRKSKAYMEESSRRGLEKMWRLNTIPGRNPGAANLIKYGKEHRFKPGHNMYHEMEPEKRKAMLEKRRATWLKLRESERRRVLFGLPQRTAFRVVCESRKKISLRHNLRRHGYILEGKACNTATITDTTTRSFSMEARAKQMGFNFKIMKFKLTDETIQVEGHTLYRIQATSDFSNVFTGDKGGFVDNIEALDQSGDCWIYNDAKVYDRACVYGNATVRGNAIVKGAAEVYGWATVSGNAVVEDYAEVRDRSRVDGDAKVLHYANIFDKARVGGCAVVRPHMCIGGSVRLIDNTFS